MKKYNVVITYGTFDLFHRGHERLLKRIAELTDKLYVGVASDRWNEIKGKSSYQGEDTRLRYVQQLPYVTGVFLEDIKEVPEVISVPLEQWLSDYKKYNADAVIMGSDHEGNLDFLREKGINIQYLSRTEGISSSQLRKQLNEGASLEDIHDIRKGNE